MEDFHMCAECAEDMDLLYRDEERSAREWQEIADKLPTIQKDENPK